MYPLLDQSSFENTISDSSLGTILVFISATWCGNCKKQDKNLEQLKDLSSSDLNIYSIDPDDNMELVKSLKVMSVPTILIYRHGVLIKKLNGVKSAKSILNHIKMVDQFDEEMATANTYKSLWERLFNK